MKKFALIGASGYIAPRHLKAIKETGNVLVAALDPFDSVGIMDSYFPRADFFTEFERFERHLDKLARTENKIDYLTVCSPNYLHDSHIRLGLRIGAHVICEKPLVLNPWNLEALKNIEQETKKQVFSILQLRLHPSIIELKNKIDASNQSQPFNVDLTYITSRGNWYYSSWKGDQELSGGVATNIGIHFFDMLQWIFGDVIQSEVHLREFDRAAGLLVLEKARVKWFLSINAETLPDEVKANDMRTFRSIQVNGDEIEFSGGFTDLHTESYHQIIQGNGFDLDDTLKSIEMAYQVRNAELTSPQDDYHPMIKLKKAIHPFKKNRH